MECQQGDRYGITVTIWGLTKKKKWKWFPYRDPQRHIGIPEWKWAGRKKLPFGESQLPNTICAHLGITICHLKDKDLD